jgi:hypothetical protein
MTAAAWRAAGGDGDDFEETLNRGSGAGGAE